MAFDKTREAEWRALQKKRRQEANAKRRVQLAHDPRVLAMKQAVKEWQHAAYERAKARRKTFAAAKKAARTEAARHQAHRAGCSTPEDGSARDGRRRVSDRPRAPELHPALVSSASLRGARWGERVARTLVARWPSWRATPRALGIAVRQVQDLAAGDDEAIGRLARVCFDAAAKRFRELAEFLDGRRGKIPTNEDEVPPL